MSASLLSPLQEDLLRAFFQREQRFFLTGGAALAGFHLMHRRTADLDLFATSNILDSGDRALREAAEALGATVENIHTSPEFRQRLVRRGSDGVKVDLAGFQAEQALPLAQRKDGGLTPATLAWVLSQIRVGDDARIPAGISVPELRTFMADLITRLTRMAYPPPRGAAG